MYGVLLTSEEQKIREEVREFVKGVDPEIIRKMEREEVKFPKEYGGRGTT